MRFNHPELIPTWPKPNYVDPVTRGPLLYIINGIFFGLATITIIVRLYTRIFVRRWVGLDDYLITFAWVCPQQPAHRKDLQLIRTGLLGR